MNELSSEEKLKKSEARLAEAQYIAHIGNWELDLISGELIWSDEVFRIFEIDPKKFGASYEAFLETVHPDDRESVDVAYAESLKNKSSYEIEHRLLMKDGSIKWVHERCQNDYDEQDKPIRSVGTVQDITTQKVAEQKLKQAHDELEYRVQQRTKELELTNIRLKETIKDAEKANAVKLRFLSAASHDLRQPLQAISMYISALSRDCENIKSKEIINKVNLTLQNITSILDVLLDISKLESGSIKPQITNFVLQELFEKIHTNLSPFAEAKALDFNVNQANIDINTDFVLLQRVVENLVSNAIRYTDKGCIELTYENNSDNVQIKVKDTGIGIQEENIDNIFEDYFQIDNPAREHKKGLGLGLSIAKQISELLGHNIDVISIPNKGSTFIVSIPHAGKVKIKQNEANENQKHDKCNAIVLLIDDDEMVLDSISMLLELEGFQVLTAMNSEGALDVLTNKKLPDIVITDYRLPGKNGKEVVQEIREKMNINFPAIILTGDTTIEETNDVKLDNYKVLKKPTDTDKLINSVVKMIT